LGVVLAKAALALAGRDPLAVGIGDPIELQRPFQGKGMGQAIAEVVWDTIHNPGFRSPRASSCCSLTRGSPTHLLLYESHELTKALFDALIKMGKDYIVLVTIVYMKGEGGDIGPVGIWEIVIPVHGPVQMPPFPVKAEPSLQLARRPDVNVAGVSQQHAQFGTEEIGLYDKARELYFGSATE
jgi:hypothetical protein